MGAGIGVGVVGATATGLIAAVLVGDGMGIGAGIGAGIGTGVEAATNVQFPPTQTHL